MKCEKLMQAVRERFDLNVVSTVEWNGRAGGIWVRDDICKESTDWYNYADGTMDDENPLNKMLAQAGWFAEPYDSETIMFYPI